MQQMRLSRVWLDERAEVVIRHQAVRRRFLETGGALFGWRTSDELVVACASGPGDHAKHRPYSFRPDSKTTQEAMAQVAASSRQRYGYVGSWHTHPRGRCAPSSVDTGTARRMTAQEDLQVTEPLLLIVSTTGTARSVSVRTICAWHWNSGAEHLTEADLACTRLEAWHGPTGRLFK